MKVIYTIYFILAGIFITPSASASLILDVQGNQLVGINNFSFDGQLFNIEFVDGTCISLFDDCDDNDDFLPLADVSSILLFYNQLGSELNSFFLGIQSLLTTENTVISGASASPFPTFFNGCDATVVCSIITPTMLIGDGRIRVASLVVSPAGTVAARLSIDDLDDLNISNELEAGDPFSTFARITTAEVPEPSMLSLLALGLLGIAVRRKRAL